MAMAMKVIVVRGMTPCRLVVTLKTFLPDVHKFWADYTELYTRDRVLVVSGSGLCADTCCTLLNSAGSVSCCKVALVRWTGKLYGAQLW